MSRLSTAGTPDPHPRDVIDFVRIEADLLEFSRRFHVWEIAYDPLAGYPAGTRLQQHGAKVIEFRQAVANFSEPTKELDALMCSGKIAHDGDPVLSWMIGNVVGHYDAKENVYPRKERPENKIDGAIALVMAIGRYTTRQGCPTSTSAQIQGDLCIDDPEIMMRIASEFAASRRMHEKSEC